MLMTSCDKFEWHNPYDPECPKELFTPSAPGATMEGNSVKLTWTQENDNISGFALFRRAEGEGITALAQTQKSTTQYLDGTITAGKKYTYYVLAVAGENKSDTIKIEITPIFPVAVTTGILTELSSDSVRISGEITNAGGGSVVSRGICWSTSPTPTISNSKTLEGAGLGQFTSTIRGLQSSTQYYARAYGENSRGVSYGAELTFSTFGPPKVTTRAIDSVLSTSAKGGGIVDGDGGSPVLELGVCWGKTNNPTILNSRTKDGSGKGPFYSRLTQLDRSTRYYVRAYATNKFGTSYGNEVLFTTDNGIPNVSTTAITSITSNSASSGGSVTSDGGSAVTAKGICWSIAQNPTIEVAVAGGLTTSGSGLGPFSSLIGGLQPSTTYYVRAYATTQFGTSYGQQIAFTTIGGPPFTEGAGVNDIDGNQYRTIIIGGKEWMAENLKVSRFSDGSTIFNANTISNQEWVSLIIPGYSDYTGIPSISQNFGKLYNWFAVNDNRNLCPNGWHVATDIEWTDLVNLAGGSNIAGGKLKESGTSNWTAPNVGATNEFTFSVLPSGWREGAGYYGLGSKSFFWSGSSQGAVSYWRREFENQTTIVLRVSSPPGDGFSVRCIKN
jgi:uncharacterized protein (TIGR02145 family)